MDPSEQEASAPAGRVRVEPRGRGKRSFWKNIMIRIFANLKLRKVPFFATCQRVVETGCPINGEAGERFLLVECEGDVVPMGIFRQF